MPKKQVQFNYITIQDALLRAEKQKELYELNLVGKSFIYAYVDKNNAVAFKEIHFDRENYLHLTGLDYQSVQYNKRVLGINLPTDALNFYNRLGKDATLINDVSFIIGSTPEETARFFKYTQQKLDNLSQLTAIAAKAEFIGKYKGNQEFDIIVNRNSSAIAFIRDNNAYIPVSSLYGKAEDVATEIKPILAIFVKENEHSQYKLSYLNSKINIGKKLFSSDLVDKLSHFSFINPNIDFKLTALDKLKHSFAASIKRELVEKANNLSDKRKNAFENDTSLAEYEKERKLFVTEIRDTFEARIAIDVLSEQNKEISNELVNEEISEIRNKFQLNASTISTPNVNKPMQMSITEDKPMQIDFSMQGGAAAMTLNPQMPNNEFFTRIANAIAKGVDSLLHKKSDTKRTQVEISDRQQPTPQQSENKTSTPTKAPAPQTVPQKQSLKAMMSKAAQQKKDMAAATKSMEKWADDVQDIQQSRKNNIHR